MVRPPQGSGLQTLLKSDVVVVGRVAGLEPMDVEAAPAAGQAKVTYRIAVVEVSDNVRGVKKDVKTVRIGFIPQVNNNPNVGGGVGGGVQILPAPGVPQPAVPPGVIMRRPIMYNGNLTLTVGQKGMFALTKHPQENFYVASNMGAFTNSDNNPNFEADVKNAKTLFKVMENTTAALKSDDQEQRFLAATILISKYRGNYSNKQVPIDTAESKLILKALQGGDWNQNVRFGATFPVAMELFNQLGVTAQDGLPNARSTANVQKWVADNADKYVIKQFVVDPNAPVQVNPLPPNGRPGVRPIRPLPPVQPGQAVPFPGQPVPLPGQAIPQPAPVQPGQAVPPLGRGVPSTVPQVLPADR